ncbi:MAG: hypothetical protein NTX09_12400 [Verrucomicrobia bacterium]|nr:hypothetical protein [Verrucomicrobiota bacterium]
MKILHRLRDFLRVPGSKSPAPPSAAAPVEQPWQRPADWPAFDPHQSAEDIIFFGPKLQPVAPVPKNSPAPAVSTTRDGSASAPVSAELPATMKEFMRGPEPQCLPGPNSAGSETKPRRGKSSIASYQTENRSGFPGIIVIGAILVGLFFGWHIGMNYGEKSARAGLADRLASAERLAKDGRRNELLRDAERDRDRALWDLARAEKEIAKHSDAAK